MRHLFDLEELMQDDEILLAAGIPSSSSQTGWGAMAAQAEDPEEEEVKERRSQ